MISHQGACRDPSAIVPFGPWCAVFSLSRTPGLSLPLPPSPAIQVLSFHLVIQLAFISASLWGRAPALDGCNSRPSMCTTHEKSSTSKAAVQTESQFFFNEPSALKRFGEEQEVSHFWKRLPCSHQRRTRKGRWRRVRWHIRGPGFKKLMGAYLNAEGECLPAIICMGKLDSYGCNWFFKKISKEILLAIK